MKRRQALALLTLSPLMTTFPVLATNADQAIDLSAQLGKVVLIDFWASWCGPCRQSFPWLNELSVKSATLKYRGAICHLITASTNLARSR